MHGNRPIPLEVLLSFAPLFQGLEQEALVRIARSTSDIRLARREMLFAEGSRCNGFHLVVQGQIKLFCTSAQGVEKVIDIVGPDRTIGETLMFTEKPYMVSAQSLTDSRLLRIPKAAILQELEVSQALRHQLLARMSSHLHELMSDHQVDSQRSGTQRFIGYLLRQLPQALDGGRDVEIRLPTSKANISSLLNLTKEHFSRILRALSQQGLIAVKGCRILIPDVAQLIGYRDGGNLS